MLRKWDYARREIASACVRICRRHPAVGIEEALAENTGVLHEVELENPVDSLTGQSAGWISVTCNSRLSGIDNAFFSGGVDH
jgi:hypothetical protein